MRVLPKTRYAVLGLGTVVFVAFLTISGFVLGNVSARPQEIPGWIDPPTLDPTPVSTNDDVESAWAEPKSFNGSVTLGAEPYIHVTQDNTVVLVNNSNYTVAVDPKNLGALMNLIGPCSIELYVVSGSDQIPQEVSKRQTYVHGNPEEMDERLNVQLISTCYNSDDISGTGYGKYQGVRIYSLIERLKYQEYLDLASKNNVPIGEYTVQGERAYRLLLPYYTENGVLGPTLRIE